MPNAKTETPDWLREMETILEELNEGVVVVDDQLRVIFANEVLTRMGQFERNEIQGCTPDAIFPGEDLPYIKWQHEAAVSLYPEAVSHTATPMAAEREPNRLLCQTDSSPAAVHSLLRRRSGDEDSNNAGALPAKQSFVAGESGSQFVAQ